MLLQRNCIAQEILLSPWRTTSLVSVDSWIFCSLAPCCLRWVRLFFTSSAIGAVPRNSCSLLPALRFLPISPRIYIKKNRTANICSHFIVGHVYNLCKTVLSIPWNNLYFLKFLRETTLCKLDCSTSHFQSSHL